MSRFWAGAGAGGNVSDSDDDSDDDKSSNSGSDSNSDNDGSSDDDSSDDNNNANNAANNAASGENRWLAFSDDEDSSDDDDARVVMSGKDRAFAFFQKQTDALRKAMKVRDYYAIQTLFDDLAKAMLKAKQYLKAGVPRPLVRILVDLEDYNAERLLDKEQFKSLSARQSRALNRMKLTLKKHNKAYGVVMDAYRQNPDDPIDDVDDDEDDDDGKSSSSSSSSSESEDPAASKAKTKGKAAKDDSDDSDSDDSVSISALLAHPFVALFYFVV